MRDYGKVSPQFWVGRTGKALRGDSEAQLVALYLMTSPHANMIGVFHCPVAYIAHETGVTLEGASKALQRLSDMDFCTYDEDLEMVFVHEFAAHQVGDTLDPKDLRWKGVKNELAKLPKGKCWQAFRARYAVPYNLPVEAQPKSPIEAPLEPLLSQKQEQEQDKEIPAANAPVVVPIAAPKQKPKAAKRPLPDGWTPDPGVPESLAAEFQTTERTILGPYLDGFRDACRANGYQYADFNAAFRNCVRQDWPKVRAKPQTFGKKPPDDLQALFARGAA